MTAQQEPVAGIAASAPPVDTSPMYKALIEARLALLAVNSFASQVAIGLIDKVLNAAPDDASAPALQAVTLEFTNELGNRIKITIEGPSSTSENILTPGEGEQLRAAMNEQAALQAGQGEPEASEVCSNCKGSKTVQVSTYPTGSYSFQLCGVCHGTGFATPTHERAAPAPEPVLPYDVTVGGGTFRKGVKLATFVLAAQGWHRAANPKFYTLTGEQKAENLRRLQDCASPSQPVAAEGVTVTDRLPEVWRWHLHNFLDVAAGEGYVLGGVDAAALFEAVFPEEYRAALSGSAESKDGAA